MKTIIIFLLTMLLVIFITSTYKPSEDILVLGYSNHEKNAITGYTKKDIKLVDIINDINNNKEVKNKTIQNYLVKAKEVIINYYEVENYKDLENVFNLVRKYCKEEIIFNTKTKTELVVKLCNKKRITCNFLLQ